MLTPDYLSTSWKVINLHKKDFGKHDYKAKLKYMFLDKLYWFVFRKHINFVIFNVKRYNPLYKKQHKSEVNITKSLGSLWMPTTIKYVTISYQENPVYWRTENLDPFSSFVSI